MHTRAHERKTKLEREVVERGGGGVCNFEGQSDSDKKSHWNREVELETSKPREAEVGGGRGGGGGRERDTVAGRDGYNMFICSLSRSFLADSPPPPPPPPPSPMAVSQIYTYTEVAFLTVL